jgi:hypothetical protein
VEPFITPARRPVLRALAEAFVPEIGQATASQWGELEATLEGVVSHRTRAVRRQLSLFLALLAVLSRLRFGKPISRLSLPQRTALLESLARSRALLARRGVWGLRTLMLMGWYTQPEVARLIGYRASPLGWTAPR